VPTMNIETRASALFLLLISGYDQTALDSRAGPIRAGLNDTTGLFISLVSPSQCGTMGCHRSKSSSHTFV